ncbi:DUF6916 family protein [Longimicrobium sp.]|jgi:hypothetical protein|uniref:DUF6916 family protein n=1 Tax=Longimicrobium sp. TaxID=2029185 RepID=UPI002F92A016
MLDTFTIETFRPRLGELFHLVVGDQRLPTKLTDVFPWGAGGGDERARVPFSLIFHTIPEAIVPQGTYSMENERMEPFQLFLVPLGPDERGMRYESVIT